MSDNTSVNIKSFPIQIQGVKAASSEGRNSMGTVNQGDLSAGVRKRWSFLVKILSSRLYVRLWKQENYFSPVSTVVGPHPFSHNFVSLFFGFLGRARL